VLDRVVRFTISTSVVYIEDLQECFQPCQRLDLGTQGSAQGTNKHLLSLTARDQAAAEVTALELRRERVS
jgi:hypothetical protein